VDASEFQFMVGDVEKEVVEPVGEEGPAVAFVIVVTLSLRCVYI
jgi:hypothetical protein